MIEKESGFTEGEGNKFSGLLRKIKSFFNQPEKYDSASDDKNELTDKDKEKVLKLVEEIAKGKSIAKELEQLGDNIQKILTTKIVREHEGRKGTFTLLHHAMLHSNEKAINDIFEKAREHQLFEQVSKELMTLEHLGSQGELIRTFSAVEYKDGVVSTRALKAEFITKDTLPITPAIETDTPTCENSKDSDNAEATNEKNEKDSTTTSTETVTQGLSVSNSTDEGNTLPPTETKDQTKPCSDSESDKENTVNKKPLTKVPQQRQAIMAGGAGKALLVSGVVSCALGMYVIAVVGGIVGLVCIGFALYNVLKPSTKLEEVKDVECSRKSPEVAL
jgi:hypothetical protein